MTAIAVMTDPTVMTVVDEMIAKVVMTVTDVMIEHQVEVLTPVVEKSKASPPLDVGLQSRVIIICVVTVRVATSVTFYTSANAETNTIKTPHAVEVGIVLTYM